MYGSKNAYWKQRDCRSIIVYARWLKARSHNKYALLNVPSAPILGT